MKNTCRPISIKFNNSAEFFNGILMENTANKPLAGRAKQYMLKLQMNDNVEKYILVNLWDVDMIFYR